MNGSAALSSTSPRADRRASARPRALLAGILIHGPADLTVNCSVRDHVETGARVRLDGPELLGTPLMLLLCRTGEAFEAHVVWRRGNEYGLSFTARHDLDRPETRREKIARRLWNEHRPRDGTIPST